MNNLLNTAAIALTASIFALAGCEEKTTPKEVGDKVEDAAEKAGDKVEDAAEKTGEAVEDAADKVEDAVDDK